MTQLFDITSFNTAFDEQKKQAKEQTIKIDTDLVKYGTKKIYDMSILDIIIGIKDTWFNLIDNVLNKNVSVQTFTKDDRLFYFGITILFITISIYIFGIMFNKDVVDKQNNIQKVYHIYKYNPGDIKH
jgi:hypothetical protein